MLGRIRFISGGSDGRDKASATSTVASSTNEPLECAPLSFELVTRRLLVKLVHIKDWTRPADGDRSLGVDSLIIFEFDLYIRQCCVEIFYLWHYHEVDSDVVATCVLLLPDAFCVELTLR